jgi:endonuclease/exonuclease/phosphatase family metal-dependent hydrolase
VNRDRFSVATFNLYNLQLPGRAMNPGQQKWTEEEFAAKVAWIGGQLRSIDADIVGLQELWSHEAMERVLAADPELEAQYDLLAEPAKGRKIWCAALVRKGLLRGTPRWVEHFPPQLKLESSGNDPQTPDIEVAIPRFSRPVLNFQVALREQPPLTEIFVAHLKSKLPERVFDEPWFKDDETFKPHAGALGAALATIRRTAEATALRILLTETMKGTVTPVIVLGDLNDGQHSNTINIITDQPHYLVGDSRGGADIGLYTAQTLQEYRDTRDVYYTHVFDDLRESLDHVLVSEQFYDNSRRRLWLFDGLVINNDHLNEEDHRTTGSGDHGVVRVDFAYKPISR